MPSGSDGTGRRRLRRGAPTGRWIVACGPHSAQSGSRAQPDGAEPASPARPRSAAGPASVSPMPRISFSTSVACSVPITPVTAPSTPASLHVGTSARAAAAPDRGSGSTAPPTCGLNTESWPSKRSTAAGDQGAPRQHAGVGHQEAGGEIVGAVAHDVVARRSAPARCPRSAAVACGSIRHAGVDRRARRRRRMRPSACRCAPWCGRSAAAGWTAPPRRRRRCRWCRRRPRRDTASAGCPARRRRPPARAPPSASPGRCRPPPPAGCGASSGGFRLRVKSRSMAAGYGARDRTANAGRAGRTMPARASRYCAFAICKSRRGFAAGCGAGERWRFDCLCGEPSRMAMAGNAHPPSLRAERSNPPQAGARRVQGIASLRSQ